MYDLNDTSWIDAETPAMAAAIRAAHRTFDDFREQVEFENFRVVPAFTDILVKVLLSETTGSQAEHVFLADPVVDAKTILGELASQPQVLGTIEPGQTVSVPHSRLTDWFLVTGDSAFGGFTVEVLKAAIPSDQLKEYCSHPPVSWFEHRGAPAIALFEATPACTRCGHKDAVAPSHENGLCGLCRSGIRRRRCASCESPILRHPGAPKECTLCIGAA